MFSIAFSSANTSSLFDAFNRTSRRRCVSRICTPVRVAMRVAMPRISMAPKRLSKSLPELAAVICANALPPGVFRDSAGLPVLQLQATRRYPPLWLVCVFVGAALYALRRWYVARYLRRIRYARSNLNRDIGQFYDIRSSAWESVWGEHMHHGLYDVVDDRRLRGTEAQVRTMNELFRLGDVKLPASHALDVGCGIGGGSRFLAERAVHVTALTLSEEQARRADALNAAAGLSERVKTRVADVLRCELEDESFDLVWSLESAEHIAPKSLLASTFWRVLRPGGTLLMAAWCLRESTTPFSISEQYAVRQIMEEYCLPSLAPPSEYVTELVRAGFRNVTVHDWTDRAKPFWNEVVRSAVFDPRGWRALRQHGWPLIRSALAMRHMMRAMDLGAMRMVAISARVPTATEVEVEKSQAIQC